MKFPIILLLAAGALSAPFNSGWNKWEELFVEKDECTDPRLKDDHTTIYNYEGETLNTVQGSTGDSTGLKLEAKVVINPLGACRYSMQIHNPELLVKSKNQQRFQTAEESGKFSRELQAQDLIFETSKGKITKLFPKAAEAVHVLNIKRGILSTLQLQEDAKTEVDVNGRCKVDIFSQEGTIIKSKNLSDCSERAHNELGIQTATFAHSKVPIKPLNSTSNCVYKIDGKVINSVECFERHIFRPFSAGYDKPAGAITTVKQTLKLAGEKYRGKANFAVETKKREEVGVSLAYEHESESLKPDNSIVSRVDKVMTSLVDTSKKDNYAAKQNSAHEFVHLVKLIRKLDRKRMIPVMERYFDCYKSGICDSPDSDLKSVYRQYFLDALTYCGTPTCISAVHNVIINGAVSGEYMNMFLQGISLVAKPTKQIIRDVMNIAEKRPSRQAFLSLGILINRYCKDNSDACAYGKRNPITHAELFLEAKLGKGCDGKEDHERVEDILMAIKAIGNAGRPTRVLQPLLTCVKNAQHINITTAALESLRRMPCNEDIQSALHTYHEDISLDTEKRIQTYLALMKCPTARTLKRIVKQLENEKSNQVGSFILSHIMNINESSDPRHKSTQELLTPILIGKDFKKFDLQFTKFSKAFEKSIYSKYLKSGVSVDGHLIYNEDNYLPRSGLFNITANIMDVPVNVIEMAARVEGVETLVEDLFGPYGYFPDDSIMKIFDVKFTKEDLQKLRSRRSVNDNDVEESVNDFHQQVNKKRTQPSGFLSMKVLGHEVRMFSYDDILWAANEIDNMNVIELLLKAAKGGHKTFTKSMMFLEMTHTVPTGLGLPMKLKLTGSAVGSVEFDGKFDIRNMFWGPSSLEVKGYVRPSAVVEVSGQMGIHSHFIDTGVFVNTSVFTSQTMKGSVVYKEGQQLKINIDAPEEPIEFFNISSTPYMFVDEEIALIKGASRRINPEFCMNSTMVLGLGVCTSMAVPVAFRDYNAPYFPLSGPAHFGLKLVKADPLLTTYQMLVSVAKKPVGTGHELAGSFEIGTPGATYSRRLFGVIKYKETQKVRTLTIGSLEAHNNAEFTVSYNNDTNRFEMDFSTNIISNKPIKMKFVYFNETSFISKEMGILASAEYDWYKFQHVTKFVQKIASASYLFHTRTTYWPKKHLTAEIEYTPKTKSLTVRLDANQINQRLVLNGSYISTKTDKGLNFTAISFGNMPKVIYSVYTGIRNTENEKLFIFNNTCFGGMKYEFIWGYYAYQKKQEVRFDANIAGATAAVYADYNNLRSGWHGVDFGASIGKNKVGLSTSYNMESKYDQQACMTVFYNHNRPAKTCLALSEVPASYNADAFKQLIWSVEVLKKTAAVAFDFKNNEKRYVLTARVLYEKKEILKNIAELTYNGIWDSEFFISSTAGTRSVSTRFYSTNTENGLTMFGVEAVGFSQFIKLQGTYSKSVKTDAVVHGIIFEGWVNKKLPVSYTLLLENAAKVKGISSILKIKDYVAKSSLMWIQPQNSEYSIVSEVLVTKKEFTIFANKLTDILILSDAKKAYKSLWQFTIWNKTFNYGYDITYENKSTEKKTAYAVVFGIDYARNKRSAMVATFANSKKATEVLVDIQYLPDRQVSHSVRYTKGTRQLDVSIEFLPKMFVKFMGRFDKIDGWKITSDLTFSWANYQRTMQWITSYINKANTKGLNFKLSAFNEMFFIGSEYYTEEKTLVFSITAFKQTARVVGFWVEEAGLLVLKLSTSSYRGNMLTPRDIIEAKVKYSKTQLVFELKTSKKILMKTVAVFDKPNGIGSFETFILNKSIFKLSTEYAKEEQKTVSRLFLLGKERFQVIGKYHKEEKTMVLILDGLRKNWNVLFSGKWIGERKEFAFNTIMMKRSFGFLVRFDPLNYVASLHGLFQKNMFGWTLLYNPKTSAVIYNITLTPRLSAQAVLQVIDDHVISASLQRKIGSEIINEFTLKYELTSAASNLMFEWNKDTTQKIRNYIMPIFKDGYKNMMFTLKKIDKISKNFVTEIANNASSKLLMLINNADMMFDNFDFVAARDQFGLVLAEGIKKTSQLTSKALTMTSKGLMKVHKNLPAIMEKTQKYTKDSLALTKSFLTASYETGKALYKMAKNVTESGLPVAKTALKLAKEFKIRGRTTEEITKDLVKMLKTIIESYKKNLAEKLETLKVNTINYWVNLDVPYSQKKLGEIYKDYVQQIKAFDVEKKVREWTKKLLEYELKGITLKEHLDKIKGKIATLPEDLKTMSIKVIRASRDYKRQARRTLEKIDSFFQPMTRCLKKIRSSVMKHFNPLFVKAKKELQTAAMQEFNKLYIPAKKSVMKMVAIIKKFIMPLIKPFKPLYTSLKDQVRAIQFMNYEIGAVFDFYTLKYKKNLELKYKKLYTSLNNKTKTIRQYVDKMSSMTPEQLTESFIDTSVEYGNLTVQKIKNVYARKEKIYKDLKERAMKAWKKLSDDISTIISKPIEDMITDAYAFVERYTMFSVKEMAQIMDQLAAIDFVLPLSKAWIEMDLLNHLDRYGVNGKIMNAIVKAKNINVTEALLRTIKETKKTIMRTYKNLQLKLKEFYKAGDVVYQYIRSIPKKDFEVFFQEVESVVMKSQKNAYKLIKNMLSKAKINLEKVKVTVTSTYEKYMNTYSKPMKQWYYLVKERANMVVDDVKDDCVLVKNFYQALITEMVKQKYEQLKISLQARYNKLYDEVMQVYRKYEDKTWEEIGMSTYSYGKKKFDKVKMITTDKFEKIKTHTKTAIEMFETRYEKLVQLITKQAELLKKLYQDTIKPETIRLYRKAVDYWTLKKFELYMKAAAVYSDIYAKVITTYEANKMLSIRQLYLKSKTFTKESFEYYMTKLKTTAKDRYGKVYAKTMMLKEKFMNEVYPIIMQESESIINQTLRASVILANETVEAFKPHFDIVKHYTMKYTSIGKTKAEEYYTSITKTSKKFLADYKQKSLDLYKKGASEVKKRYEKVFSYLENALEKVKSHPRYLEIINHELYIKISNWVKMMIKIIEKKIEELKAKIEMLKAHPKIAELKKRLKELREHEKVKMVLNVLKQVNESGTYTFGKLKRILIAYKGQFAWRLVHVPALVRTEITFFRQYPEEGFWKNIGMVKSALRDVREYDWKSLKTSVPEFAKGFYNEVTDAATKEFVLKTRKAAVDSWKRLVALPDTIKAKAMTIYKEQIKMLKEKWQSLITQWKESPFYPIVAHEIWSELADELRSHEIVTELQSLATVSVKKLKVWNAEFVKKVEEFMKNKKAVLKVKIDRLVEKYNKFIDETTLEMIVAKSQKLYSTASIKLAMHKDKAMKELKKLYTKAKTMAMTYKTKVTKFGKVYYLKVEKIWNEQYPKVMKEVKDGYKKFLVEFDSYLKKGMKYYDDMKDVAIAKSLKLWNESVLKKELVTFKGMTVGETVAIVMKMPENAKVMYKDVAKMAKARYNLYVQPHLTTIRNVLKSIGNEINETAVFVYRYYQVKENAKHFYNKGYQKVKSIIPKFPVLAKQYTRKISKASLKGLHTTLVYLDSVDLKPYIVKLKALVPDIKKYVTLQVKSGQVVLSINHPKYIKPSFKHHVTNVKNKVKTVTENLKTKTMAITNDLLKSLKEKTMEIRRDLNTSAIMHMKLLRHLKSRSGSLKEVAMKQSALAKSNLKKMIEDVRKSSMKHFENGKISAKAIFDFGKVAVKSILASESLPEAFETTKTYYKTAAKSVKETTLKYYKKTEKTVKEILGALKLIWNNKINEIKPYYTLVVSATKDWRSGVEFRTAFKKVENQLKDAYKSAVLEIKEIVDMMTKSIASEDLEMFKDYLGTHKGIISKYMKRLYRMYKWNKIRLERAIRRSKMIIKHSLMHKIKVANPLRSYAMIFGKNHVMTFDGKFYDFIKHPKGDCTYLLGRDFKNGNFTLLAQEKHIIVKTPEMEVKIHQNGRVDGLVTITKDGVTTTKVVKDLPIETDKGYCIMWRRHIRCNFNQGIILRCDVNHFMCSVELSGWHYGKSQGLLGTNNNEAYDEFKMPNNKLTNSVSEFANSWLVSKDQECKMDNFGNEAPTCNKAPSERCFELFKMKTSPFAKFFDQVDPLPFLKACQIDSADCDSTEPVATSHCNATAAYRHVLYLKDIHRPKIADCVTADFETGKETEKRRRWVQKGTRDVDVAVIISTRTTGKKFRRTIASMLYKTNKNLQSMGFNARYALISYGATTVSYFGSQYHTLDGMYFSNEEDITTAIKRLSFTGTKRDTNDYYSAIFKATRLPFRPSAARIFYLFNFDEYKPAWFGPSYDETKFALKYEANASLFVFDDFSFKKIADREMIGKTKSRVYLSPYRAVPLATEFPVTPFTKLVRCSGGMFVNNLKPSQKKTFTAALSDATVEPLNRNMRSCKLCFRRYSKIMCSTDNTITC